MLVSVVVSANYEKEESACSYLLVHHSLPLIDRVPNFLIIAYRGWWDDIVSQGVTIITMWIFCTQRALPSIRKFFPSYHVANIYTSNSTQISKCMGEKPFSHQWRCGCSQFGNTDTGKLFCLTCSCFL